MGPAPGLLQSRIGRAARLSRVFPPPARMTQRAARGSLAEQGQGSREPLEFQLRTWWGQVQNRPLLRQCPLPPPIPLSQALQLVSLTDSLALGLQACASLPSQEQGAGPGPGPGEAPSKGPTWLLSFPRLEGAWEGEGPSSCCCPPGYWGQEGEMPGGGGHSLLGHQPSVLS